MPGRSPTPKRASYALARQLEALSLVGQGLPVIEIARRMDLSVARVRIHLHHALKAGLTLYPSALNADEVNNLRQLQAEVLATSRQKALEAQAVISGRIGTSQEKNTDGVAAARLCEAVARSVDLEANLFGTKVPIRIQEESMRLQVNRTEQRVTISWDKSILDPPARPVPGLFIGGRCN
jgi:hypothetical protein